ncbi:hypothetical protein PtrSN002B_001470 [Pyrenophora tritici-repentis]|nr:hypothetical protein Alg215_02861 [Pyrenophora tritici-repentis]KAI1546810.1 hypothetical protein PtrSN001A_001829 [Pyrenophora tritici-repentis]KAI1557193.1 hypothetical protein PtrSN002B_001470 [Pyrenophora tritici-repentis]KAI1576060.1 hypothetical protein PtrEW4_002323 [Pyrenophora tritici-repentis]KAI1587541.1 hypothetical protein PtrEW13061_007153 [Pyrenophora tritici-repentis]
MLLPTFFAALVLTTATQAKITTHTTTLVINAYYDATANTVATSISTTSFTLSTPLFLAPAPTEEAARQTIDGYTIKVAASTSEAIQQPVSEYIIVVGDSTHKATQQVIQQTITDLAITRTSDQTSSQLTSQPTSTTTTTLTTEPIQQTTTTLIVSTHTNTSPTKPAEPTPPATWIFPATATLLLYDLVTMALW